MKKTDQIFWDEHWQKIRLPSNALDSKSLVGEKLCSLIVQEVGRMLRKDREEEFAVLELGGAPGTFLSGVIRLLEERGVKAKFKFICLDNSKTGLKKAQENFKKQNMKVQLIRKDLLANKDFRQIPKADFIYSTGLIEHFSGRHLEQIVDNHLNLLDKQGRILICIPFWAPFIWENVIKCFNPLVYKTHNEKLVTKKDSLKEVVLKAGKRTKKGRIIKQGELRDWEHWEVLADLKNFPSLVRKIFRVFFIFFDPLSKLLALLGLAPVVDKWVVVKLEEK